ncbi:MAG TPA: PDZ domain-containing protein [Candidatus Binataceae bacterium]|nr:PDZ domain-containing protein [Candidatus Binataceae bacterium]
MIVQDSIRSFNDALLCRLTAAKPRFFSPIPILFALIPFFLSGSVAVALAQSQASPAPDASVSTPPGVGSIDDYVGDNGSVGLAGPLASYVPMLGIAVFRGGGKLADGRQMNGLAVSVVDHQGPAYDAGVRAAHVRMGTTAAKIGATVLIFGAGAVFPPALLGLPLVSQINNTKAFDVIVAVDAERIRDVNELENSLRRAKAGETVYLTVIRDGRRVQLHMAMPAVHEVLSASSIVPE